jgi:hypothetical protein
MGQFFSYDPGRLPTAKAPDAGERIEFCAAGLPPYKDISFSIRNPRHRYHACFVALRVAAANAMAGRAWSHGAIGLWLELFAPTLDRALVDYCGGVMDTLDGSHGPEFTYLPIVYNDDCQVCESRSQFHQSEDTRYVVRIEFLANTL